MKPYRLYFLNAFGHIVDATALQCETDDEAASIAQSQEHERPWELWSLDRLVSTFEGPQPEQ